MKYHEERIHEYGEICQMYPCDECAFSAVNMTELKKHKGNYHVESLLVDDFDMIPSSTMLETHGRIKQRISIFRTILTMTLNGSQIRLKSFLQSKRLRIRKKVKLKTAKYLQHRVVPINFLNAKVVIM